MQGAGQALMDLRLYLRFRSGKPSAVNENLRNGSCYFLRLHADVVGGDSEDGATIRPRQFSAQSWGNAPNGQQAANEERRPIHHCKYK